MRKQVSARAEERKSKKKRKGKRKERNRKEERTRDEEDPTSSASSQGCLQGTRNLCARRARHCHSICPILSGPFLLKHGRFRVFHFEETTVHLGDGVLHGNVERIIIIARVYIMSRKLNGFQYYLDPCQLENYPLVTKAPL